MNKQALAQVWEQTRQKYGIFLRLLEVIPEEKYHAHPVPGMRTFAEIATHLSTTIIRDISVGIAKGAITANEHSEADVAKGIQTRAQLLTLARDCWDSANAAVAKVGDAELQAIVPTPWGMSIPGWVGFSIQTDEFIHHRGQLYTFARAFGIEPPFMWDFAHNAPEFRPAA